MRKRVNKVKGILRKFGVSVWIKLASGKVQLRDLVNRAIKLRVP